MIIFHISSTNSSLWFKKNCKTELIVETEEAVIGFGLKVSRTFYFHAKEIWSQSKCLNKA